MPLVESSALLCLQKSRGQGLYSGGIMRMVLGVAPKPLASIGVWDFASENF